MLQGGGKGEQQGGLLSGARLVHLHGESVLIHVGGNGLFWDLDGSDLGK